MTPDTLTRALRDAATAAIGGPLLAAEEAGIDDALRDLAARPDAVLPKVALGTVAGLNGDWPAPMRRAALSEYNLDRVPVR